ncbi:hypothetical protein PMIT1313_01096 [Prochlorococcus marinus str. MIT 1313]|uniref:PqqD family protein n=1 Tax=Prochlorococcus TaxID=1218 RepID=UPI0007B32D7B|nr:PqqD family protein [Prochlorococcus marinus]KZR69410.1 hypothetical protein PMIT1313_01096 [Prochlorococcus marinus str. MIT 1313]KZR72644.1 hypothetical protein PMIT1318_01160 [Prochlorococcus marinus str. MIT 1318]
MEGSEDKTESCLYKRDPKAIFTDLDGETALFQAETCEYLVLNSTGSAIWELIETPSSLNDICKQLSADYEVSIDTCIRETKAWLSIAVEKGVALSQPIN